MGTLTFPGLSTGIDTSEIVEQLMAVESRQLARYKLKLQDLTAKIDAVEALKNAAASMESAAEDLADRDVLQTYNSSTSDSSVLDITVDSDAKQGTHSILVNQLATTETWIQDTSTFSYETDFVGAGTFIYSYNYQERSITTTATTTLEDFVGLINNDEDNPGVTASLLYQGDKYHLILTGHETGEDYQITINDSSTEVWKPDTGAADHTFTDDGDNAVLSTRLILLDQWSGGITGDETITISGKDHNGNTILPARTLTLSNDSTLAHLIDDINYYFEGVATARLENGKIILTDHTSGASGMEISLTYNDGDASSTLGLPTMAVSTEGGGTSASLSSMASSSFVETQDAQNAQIKIDNYTPTYRAEVQTIVPDAPATAGTFTITYGSDSAEIDFDASISEIQSELNALASITALGGVTVTGDSMDTSPVDGGFTVTFASSAGNVDMLTINVSGLTGPSSATVSETTRGNNDQWITRNSNVISDALSGITLNLFDVNDEDDNGDPIAVEITINRDKNSVKEKIESFVASYNSVLDLLEEYTEYDDETGSMGILSNDVAVTLIKTQIKNPFISVATGFTSLDDFIQATDIGLSYDAEGYLELDSDTFNDAIDEDYMDVINLLSAAETGSSDSDIIEFLTSSGAYTQAGSYDVTVTVNGSGTITSAQIKLDSESTYRDMNIEGNLVYGNSNFDSSYNPLYAENGLYLQIDTSSAGTFTATVNVKQGIFNHLSALLADITETDGRLDVSMNTLNDKYDKLSDDIDDENVRLDTKEEVLVEKFARLERTLSELNSQMSQVSAMFG
jgi:flagellar hook-associated protein 2